ncbi:UPF0496 protein At3g49070 [Actinidia eriantha]|uniref:UPF0496 protein At3g49070 n=1 Tax=Actinidia eriantha TaxID=165200 RepID=UPI002588920A|nr:UPF0496 protein At3g49070 [Actinidia eriantha]XP_057463739.1 UPF0496 protein At3g49070 [Actinidia eriantha]
MKLRISVRIKKLLSFKKVTRFDSSTHSTTVDVREEYANAFRTESYNEFWIRVLVLNTPESLINMGSTSADRLPSYRLFAEHLLDPDQPTVTQVLALARNRPENHTLLSDYFLETADASLLCSLLLKDIDHTRVKYRSLKTTIDALETAQLSPVNHLPVILTRLTEFSNSSNPFIYTASSPHRYQAIQAGCTGLLKRLESSRDKARAKLQRISKIQRGSAVFLVAFAASLTAIITTHALALLVASPALIVGSLELASSRKLVRFSAQLNAAAKGTYILNRDLDTISRLVARVNDELEHMRAMVRFLLERGEERIQVSWEVARQLKKTNSSFSQQLDELEEHLYLCFMNINRARNLVVNEILDQRKSHKAPNFLI